MDIQVICKKNKFKYILINIIVITRLPKDKGYNRINKSGSARTEGYFTITDTEKSLYLPLRNKAIIPTEPSTTSISSRMNRINNRRLAVGIEMQKKISSSETDILRFNALKARKKQLKFSKSPIHNWGLYAMEHIDMGDMVIEYVGEIVRQTVADIRERYGQLEQRIYFNKILDNMNVKELDPVIYLELMMTQL